MPAQHSNPSGPDAPTLEDRVDRLETGLVGLHERLEEIVAAQDEVARGVGSLSRLLADVAAGGRTDR